MGVTIDNLYLHRKNGDVIVISHRNPGDDNEYAFSVIGANQSPTFSQADHESLKGVASNGFAAFDSAAGSMLGAFWSGLSGSAKNDFFELYSGDAIGRLRFRLHRANVDVMSVFSTEAQTPDLLAEAVTGFQGFDALAGVVWGSSWTNDPPMTSARRQGFRNATAAL